MSERRTSGFTMIELLAVILIIGILAGVLITQLSDAQEGVEVADTRNLLTQLEAAVDFYETEEGSYPLSFFTDKQGVPNEGQNVGSEALVVALWSNGFEAGGLGDMSEDLVNTDNDQSSVSLTDFDSRELFELPDSWGNPVAYIHQREYENKPRPYLTFDPVTGEEIVSAPKALKSEKTGRFFRLRSFQLISAGPDGTFGTEDDITNFETD